MNHGFRLWRPISFLHCPQYRFSSCLRTSLAKLTSSSLGRGYASRRVPSVHLIKVNRLVSKINDQIENTQDVSAVESFIRSNLSMEEYQNFPRRQMIFERIVFCLLENQLFSSAGKIRSQMMEEGLVPSAELNAALSVATLGKVRRSTRALEKSLGTALRDTFQDPSYSERHLCRLLDLLRDLDSPRTHRLWVAQLFIETRPSGYAVPVGLVARMIRLQAEGGSFEDAFRLLETDADQDSEGSENIVQDDPQSSEAERTRLYSSMLVGVRDAKSGNRDVVDKVLQHMRDRNVPVSTSVFNTLISTEVRRGSLVKAFALYRILVDLSKSWPCAPDVYTFGTMFTALQHTTFLRIRNARSRRFKISEEVMTPRQLFHDLVTFYQLASEQTPPPSVITPSVLNVVLRTFLSRCDYAASFIALRTFVVLDLKLTMRTYYIVMKQLMDRIRYDLGRVRQRHESRWGDYMLGLTREEALRTTVDTNLAESVLNYGAQISVDQQPSPTQNQHLGQFIPSLAQIDGDEPLPEGQTLSPLPLLRILRRAILADYNWKRGQVSNSVDDHLPPAQAVSGIIQTAKKQMLPVRIYPLKPEPKKRPKKKNKRSGS